MKRVLVLAVSCVAAPLIGVGCGSDGTGSGTLPPIATTSSTSTTIATTTTLPEFYVVQSGDTLSKIVTKLGVSKDDLMALNGITNPDHIEKGQKLKIPRPGMVIPSTVPPSTTVPAETTAPA
jgi:LysM repeat protein